MTDRSMVTDDAWCRECHGGFASKESSSHDHEWVVPLVAVREALNAVDLERMPADVVGSSAEAILGWCEGFEACFAAIRAALFGENGDG